MSYIQPLIFVRLHTMRLCFCMNSGDRLHLNTPPAKHPFTFPQSTDMSVNVDDYFQMSFRGASPTCWCYHMSRQSLKCHQCYKWQLVPVGSLTVSWFGCSEDAVQEFLVLSQTLRATDIQMRKSQAENSYLLLLGFDEIMFQSTERSLSGLNVVFK